MPLRQLSRQMEQDVSYLLWRARTHEQSEQELFSQFTDLSNSYRRLVASKQLSQMDLLEQQDLLENLIASYRSRLS